MRNQNQRNNLKKDLGFGAGCLGSNPGSVTAAMELTLGRLLNPLSASVFSALNGGNISSLLLRWLEGLNEMLYVKPKALRLRHAVRIHKY